MATTELHVPSGERCRGALSERDLWHSFVAFDDRPQAHRYPVSDFSYLFLFRRRTIRFTDSHPPTTPGGYLVTPETYNKLFTMHGVAMIFFFLIPSIPAVLAIS